MATTRTPSRPEVFYGWWIVAACFLIYFMSGGLFGAATVYFKALTEEFGWNRGELSTVFALGFLVAGISSPIWGRIADRRGPRASFLPGVLLSGILCIALSRISSLASLYVLYLLLSFGLAGISLIPISVVISNWFVSKRGRAIGIAYTGVGFGGLFLIPLIGLLVAGVGWRYAYVVSGIAVVVILTPAAFWMKDRPANLGLYPDGIDPTSVDPTSGQAAHPSGGNAVAFSLAEAIKTSTFWLVAATWFVTLMPLTAVNLHQVPFMTDIGLSTELASLAAGAVGGASIIGRIGVGFLSERYPIRLIYSACYAAMAVGIASLWGAGSFGSHALVAYVAFFGIAVGGSFALTALLVGHLFGVRALGEIFGLLGLAATIGGALGGAGAGFLFDLAGSYDIVFALCVGLCALGSILILFVRRPGPSGAVTAP